MNTLFPEVSQSEIGFPVSLTEKYRPAKIDGFVGLPKAKAVFQSLLRAPRPCALLLIGPPGSGKTSMALAFARQLHAGLIHHASAKMTVDALAETLDRVQYYPESGGFWVVVVDEAERMSYQAQVAFLSPLDSTATLRPKFGGGMEQGKPLPVIWIFTCNGRGDAQTDPPDTFEPRFLSRCLQLQFDTSNLNGDLSAFLAQVWKSETSSPGPDFDAISHGCGGSVREALQSLDLELLVQGVESKPVALAVAPVGAKPVALAKPAAVVLAKPADPKPAAPGRPAKKLPASVQASIGSMFAYANR